MPCPPGRLRAPEAPRASQERRSCAPEVLEIPQHRCPGNPEHRGAHKVPVTPRTDTIPSWASTCPGGHAGTSGAALLRSRGTRASQNRRSGNPERRDLDSPGNKSRRIWSRQGGCAVLPEPPAHPPSLTAGMPTLVVGRARDPGAHERGEELRTPRRAAQRCCRCTRY